jgi:hypothetical protein
VTRKGHRILTKEQERELIIDTMASWALEGMEPDRETIADINARGDSPARSSSAS